VTNDDLLKLAAKRVDADRVRTIANGLEEIEYDLALFARQTPLRQPIDDHDEDARLLRKLIRGCGQRALEIHLDVEGSARWYHDLCTRLRDTAVRLFGEHDGPALVPLPWQSSSSTRIDAR
jgi:hypothetical protein